MNQKIALLSVSDKSGLGEFAQELVKSGFSILSTGGTMKHLQANDWPTDHPFHLGKATLLGGGGQFDLQVHPQVGLYLAHRTYVGDAMDNRITLSGTMFSTGFRFSL